jgi:enoyl-CoA hydratase
LKGGEGVAREAREIGEAGESDDVLTRVDGAVGLITLNRPKAINSLNQPMVDALRAILTHWEADDAVRAVVLSGAGDRGLCAGGDVVAVYHSAREDGVEARRFWRAEYLLNGQIGRFAKPYVSLMDGIVMGGGVGVSAHANIRVVTDTSKVAMPEVGIGFVPDVGGAFLLARAPGALGLYAALTGAPFSGSDATAMGFADHYVPHGELDAFAKAIVDDGVEAALAAHAVEPPPSELAPQREWIDKCFAGDTVEDIVDALRGHGTPPAPRSPCRWPWRRCVAPPSSTRWKTFWCRTIGCQARLRAHTTWWRASGRRSSTKIATRSGRRRRWPKSPPPTWRPTSRRSTTT